MRSNIEPVTGREQSPGPCDPRDEGSDRRRESAGKARRTLRPPTSRGRPEMSVNAVIWVRLSHGSARVVREAFTLATSRDAFHRDGAGAALGGRAPGGDPRAPSARRSMSPRKDGRSGDLARASSRRRPWIDRSNTSARTTRAPRATSFPSRARPQLHRPATRGWPRADWRRTPDHREVRRERQVWRERRQGSRRRTLSFSRAARIRAPSGDPCEHPRTPREVLPSRLASAWPGAKPSGPARNGVDWRPRRLRPRRDAPQAPGRDREAGGDGEDPRGRWSGERSAAGTPTTTNAGCASSQHDSPPRTGPA